MWNWSRNIYASLFLAFMVKFVLATNQSMLLKDLFRDYYEGVIPRCNGNMDPIDVQIGIALRQIVELNEPRQILTLNAWLRLGWTDCRLVWNASHYGGIDSIVLPYSKVWTPDITLYDNNQNGIGVLSGLTDYRPFIMSDGTVRYLFPTVVDSLCNVDSTYFPFDEQTCPLQFGSWSYNGFDLNVVNRSSGGDTGSYKPSTEWDLLSVEFVRSVNYYSCCPEPYPDVTFYLKLKRKPSVYLVSLLIPCILITTMSLCGFLLPPDSGEKIGLEITVLLALAFLSLVVSDTLPPSESVPYLGIYFVCSVFMVSFSTIMTVFVLNIHYSGHHGRPVPKWIRKVAFGFLSRLVLFKGQDAKVVAFRASMKGSGLVNRMYVPEDQGMNVQEDEGMYGTDDPEIKNNSSSAVTTKPLLRLITKQLTVMKKIEEHIEEKAFNDNMHYEWQRVAIVMDRLFFLLFLAFNLSCTLVVFITIA